MSKILAIDLGKFKSVTCLLDTETNASTVVLSLVNFSFFTDNYNAGAATRAEPGWVGRTRGRKAVRADSQSHDQSIHAALSLGRFGDGGYTSCECRVRINHPPNSNRRHGGEYGRLSFRAARLPV